MRPTRLGLALLLVPLVLALVAAACGGDGADDGSGPTSTPSGGTYPVTIEHATGATTFDARPERIVSLNVQWTDAALALGVQPVGYVLDQASLEEEPYPWHAELLGDATRIDANGSVPFEAIARLEPDLILVTFLGLESDVFATLEGIAPTIGMLGELQVDRWQDQVEVLGRVLGEEDRAGQVVADVEAEVAGLAEELPGLRGKTYVAANYVAGDGIYVVADPDDGASELFYALGMTIDPDILALDEDAVGRVELSFEQVDLLDADFLGILTNGSDPSELPGWNQLAAVQAGAIVDLEFVDVVGLNTPTPLSVPHVLDLLRPALEAVASD